MRTLSAATIDPSREKQKTEANGVRTREPQSIGWALSGT